MVDDPPVPGLVLVGPVRPGLHRTSAPLVTVTGTPPVTSPDLASTRHPSKHPEPHTVS